MSAEIIDLVVEKHETPMIEVSDDEGRLHIVPQLPPPGEGWRLWAGEELEDGTTIGHYERRRGVTRGE